MAWKDKYFRTLLEGMYLVTFLYCTDFIYFQVIFLFSGNFKDIIMVLFRNNGLLTFDINNSTSQN